MAQKIMARRKQREEEGEEEGGGSGLLTCSLLRKNRLGSEGKPIV